MKRNLIWFLILLFLLEGTMIPWLIPEVWSTHVQVAPHFITVTILYMAIFMNRYYALVFGLIFGLLQDIIYFGHTVGLQSFSMGLTGYLIGLIFRSAHLSMFSALSAIFVGIFTYEGIVYALYRLFRIVEFSFSWALMQIVLPSLVINLLFALLIYIPARNYLEGIGNKRQEND
ncbi:MAG TPA: rod shape-determining protein MreD [Bacilli bacterium]